MLRLVPVVVVILLPILSAAPTSAQSSPTIEFNRDVRPILADHCFQCHGPDVAQRKADLRLDVEPKPDREGGPILIPGQPDKSELFRRVKSSDPDEKMPPPGKGTAPTDNELNILQQWITSGAKFEKHWSLLPIRHPDIPLIQTRSVSEAISNTPPTQTRSVSEGLPRTPLTQTRSVSEGLPPTPLTQTRSVSEGANNARFQHSSFSIHNSLDPFILDRLEKADLTPSPPADKPTLLRRASFALTGLPPSLDDLQEFAAVPTSASLNSEPRAPSPEPPIPSPDWYERYIDKLLASPRYGERLAVPWLDAARYADTSGYQSDGERHMWRWRDWVVEALNANLPFDQFTIEQLAGDLLPSATLDQKIATGFNRNHRGNAEGGIIPEEYAAEYVADRVETTATVWLGLTLGCCRCHDHKYDPLTQRDFYSLFAFFNNIPEKGRAIKIGNSPPYIQAPTRLQAEDLQRLELRHGFGWRNPPPIFLAILEWEQSRRGMIGDWYPTDGLVAHLPLDGDTKEQVNGIIAEPPPENCDFAAGRLDRAGQFNGSQSVELPNAGDFGFFDKFSLAAWIYVKPGSGGTIVSHMVDEPQGEGYQLALVGGKLQFNLSKRWLDDALRVETVDSLIPGTWRHVVATYDGSRDADGVRLYVDGEPRKLNVLLDELNQTFATKQPLRVGGGGGSEGRFHGAIDDVRIYARALPPEEALVLATPQTLDEIFSIENFKRTAGQAAKLQFAFLEEQGPEEIRSAYKKYKAGQHVLAEFREKLPTVMVMEELPTPRETHILLRGQYDKPGDPVLPNTPAELPPLASASSPSPEPRTPIPPASPSRLDLARWLVNRDNPLTARVIVNRAWQLHFGAGLVKSSEDFGRQGESPSHLDLLDHLASEFQSDWDVKRLHRTIVTSATYRQSSEFKVQSSRFKVGADKSTLNFEPGTLNSSAPDPDNRLLSRGPRLRLSAEQLRDQALFVSGELVEQLGGPSVKPLQPPGLWSELTGGDDYKPGTGPDLVRRSLYTFWK
ncbi:MAG TPA: DUF1549 domain-containing protein, partial [Pirellulaceae bacterium]